MAFCTRHADALVLAVGTLGVPNEVGFDAEAFARQAIVNHATHFAGKAAVEMLAPGYCPLCFVNRAIARDGRNPGLTVDDWVDRAAEEALQESVRRQDQADAPPVVAVK